MPPLPRSPRNIPKRKSRSSPAPKRKAPEPPAVDPQSLEARFAGALSALGPLPKKLALALSGGGDSLALMHLLKDAAQKHLVAKPDIVIVDHGLPVHTGKEPVLVAGWVRKAGLKPHVLHWKGAKPGANVEALAREARYRLIGDWAKKNRIGAIFLAHTEDDQAETFLLRLARGSGVDGLSSMRARGVFPFGEGPEILRPLLSTGREELRAFLKARKLSWLEDPMNSQERYARARLRAIWPHLKGVGLTPSRIAGASAHLARARTALEDATGVWLDSFAQQSQSGAAFDASRLGSVPREIGLRVLSALLVRVSGKPYRPRFDSLERLYKDVSAPGFAGATLMGCRIAPAPKSARVFGDATVTIAPESARGGAKTKKKPARKGARKGGAKPAP